MGCEISGGSAPFDVDLMNILQTTDYQVLANKPAIDAYELQFDTTAVGIVDNSGFGTMALEDEVGYTQMIQDMVNSSGGSSIQPATDQEIYQVTRSGI